MTAKPTISWVGVSRGAHCVSRGRVGQRREIASLIALDAIRCTAQNSKVAAKEAVKAHRHHARRDTRTRTTLTCMSLLLLIGVNRAPSPRAKLYHTPNTTVTPQTKHASHVRLGDTLYLSDNMSAVRAAQGSVRGWNPTLVRALRMCLCLCVSVCMCLCVSSTHMFFSCTRYPR